MRIHQLSQPLCALILGVFLVACGGSGGGSDASSTGSGDTSSTGGGGSGTPPTSQGIGPTSNPSEDTFTESQQQYIAAARAVYMSTDLLLDVHLNSFDLIDFLRPFVEGNGPNPAPPPSPVGDPNETDSFPDRYDVACPEGGSITVLEWEDRNTNGELDYDDQFAYKSDPGRGCFYDVNEPGLATTGNGFQYLDMFTSNYVDPVLRFWGNTDSSATDTSATVSDLDGAQFRIDHEDRNRCRLFFVAYEFQLGARDRLAISGTADLLLDQLGGCAATGGFYAYVEGADRYHYEFDAVTLDIIDGRLQLVSGSITISSEDIGSFTLDLAADPAFATITGTMPAFPAFDAPQQDIFVSLNPMN